MIAIKIRSKKFPGLGNDRPVELMRDIELTVKQGENVVILGSSGVGKTTLMNVIAGLDRDYDGAVTRIDNGGPTMPHVGFVFQEPRLLPWLTVRQNLALVLEHENPDDSRIGAALADMDLTAAAARYANRLSLGMARRVALARALIIKPDLLLLDEPLASLDEATAGKLRGLLAALFEERRCSSLLVTHNLDEAVHLGDRVVLLGGAPTRIVGDLTLTEPRRNRNAAWRAEETARLRTVLPTNSTD